MLLVLAIVGETRLQSIQLHAFQINSGAAESTGGAELPTPSCTSTPGARILPSSPGASQSVTGSPKPRAGCKTDPFWWDSQRRKLFGFLSAWLSAKKQKRPVKGEKFLLCLARSVSPVPNLPFLWLAGEGKRAGSYAGFLADLARGPTALEPQRRPGARGFQPGLGAAADFHGGRAGSGLSGPASRQSS